MTLARINREIRSLDAKRYFLKERRDEALKAMFEKGMTNSEVARLADMPLNSIGAHRARLMR